MCRVKFVVYFGKKKKKFMIHFQPVSYRNPHDPKTTQEKSSYSSDTTMTVLHEV